MDYYFRKFDILSQKIYFFGRSCEGCIEPTKVFPLFGFVQSANPFIP